MKNLIYQWKNYFNWIHYKLFLKKKIEKLEKETKNQTLKLSTLLKIKNKIKDLEEETISYIDNSNNPDKSLKLNLISKEIYKMNIFRKIWYWIFKFDGFIFYLNKADDIKIYKVRNLGYLYKKSKELYNIHKKAGTHKGKPAFIVKYPYTISLTPIGKFLYYDAEAYNNYVNVATKGNLTNIGNKFDFGSFLKSNFVYIIIGIALIFLFVTPEGKEFLQGLINQ